MRRCWKELWRVSGKCPSLESLRTRKDNYICPSWRIWLFCLKARGWHKTEHFSKTLSDWEIWTFEIFTWYLRIICCEIFKYSHILIIIRVYIVKRIKTTHSEAVTRALGLNGINLVALSGTSNLLTLVQTTQTYIWEVAMSLTF